MSDFVTGREGTELAWPDLGESVSAVESTDEKIDRLIARMDAVEGKITEFIDTVKPYLAEIMPLLERIESSPVFKMIAGGKKK